MFSRTFVFPTWAWRISNNKSHFTFLHRHTEVIKKIIRKGFSDISTVEILNVRAPIRTNPVIHGSSVCECPVICSAGVIPQPLDVGWVHLKLAVNVRFILLFFNNKNIWFLQIRGISVAFP